MKYILPVLLCLTFVGCKKFNQPDWAYSLDKASTAEMYMHEECLERNFNGVECSSKEGCYCK